jgi:CubicO group peptidase (beta-lactamase class C family)
MTATTDTASTDQQHAASQAAVVTPTVDPAEVGFDASRLARLDKHFAGYVDKGKLAGWQLVVSRRGEVAHTAHYGKADLEAGDPVRPDTLWRIYSMTKPITSVAAMMLWEQGRFELNTPISRWLPEFAEPKVYAGGPPHGPLTVPATEPIRVWHLLTHTSGLTYGFARMSVVDGIYRRSGFEQPTAGSDLAEACRTWARMPLLFNPGSSWNYSVSTDVLGRLVEAVSGQPLDVFFRENIFGPLGMTDTSFWVEEARRSRLAALYAREPRTGGTMRMDGQGAQAITPATMFSGGGGLVSSAADYQRFVQLLARGGELDGVRLLSNRTVRMMATNHLPGNADLAGYTLPTAIFRDPGVGFGLGFAVVLNPTASHTHGSPGEFYWGGMASTAFWVDPVEDLTVTFFTQLTPSSTYPIRPQLRQMVYSALVD